MNSTDSNYFDFTRPPTKSSEIDLPSSSPPQGPYRSHLGPRRQDWLRVRKKFVECFLLQKTAYRRANGGSTAPSLHEDEVCTRFRKVGKGRRNHGKPWEAKMAKCGVNDKLGLT